MSEEDLLSEIQNPRLYLRSAEAEAIPMATQSDMLAMFESFDNQVMALVNAMESANKLHHADLSFLKDPAKDLVVRIMLCKESIKRHQRMVSFDLVGTFLKEIVSICSPDDDTDIFDSDNDDDHNDDDHNDDDHNGDGDGDDVKSWLTRSCDTLKIWRLTLDVKVSFIQLKKATNEWNAFFKKDVGVTDVKKIKIRGTAYAADGRAETFKDMAVPLRLYDIVSGNYVGAFDRSKKVWEKKDNGDGGSGADLPPAKRIC